MARGKPRIRLKTGKVTDIHGLSIARAHARLEAFIRKSLQQNLMYYAEEILETLLALEDGNRMNALRIWTSMGADYLEITAHDVVEEITNGEEEEAGEGDEDE